MNESEKKFGVVKFLNFKEGYGFIELPGTSEPDVFFSLEKGTVIVGEKGNPSYIKKGDEVSFFSKATNKRPIATEIIVLPKLGSVDHLKSNKVVRKKKTFSISKKAKGGHKGTIKSYKGSCYGFIIPKEGGADIFFHVSGINKGVAGYDESLLVCGQCVTFEIGGGRKGLEAYNVKLQF